MQAGSGCSTGCGTSSVFGNYTSVTSHELSETITDADVGIAKSIAAPIAWDDTNGEEIGDLCNAQQGSYVANAITYTIQMEFSNAANNCVLPPTTVPPNPVLSANTGQVESGQSVTLSWTPEFGDASSYKVFETFCSSASCAPPQTGTPILVGTESAKTTSLRVLVTRSALFQVKACNFPGCDTGSELVGVSAIGIPML